MTALRAFAALPLLFVTLAQAQAPAKPAANHADPAAQRSVFQWIQRMNEATRNRTYAGTFVVSSSTGMGSAKVWHACDGAQQIERVEVLSGEPRTTLRHNQNVVTFMPQSRTALVEQRDSLTPFPTPDAQEASLIADNYTSKLIGVERIAGHDAEIVQLTPKDQLRYGYRIWSEQKSGLMVKLQTLDDVGRVLEQVAFSDLQLGAPVSMPALISQMNNKQGFKVERRGMVKTTAAAEGWALRAQVPGYKPTGCHRRADANGQAADNAMQWVFSDGLASVSLFVEPFDAKRHTQEGVANVGATNTLTRKLDGQWWLAAVGEVPVSTLRAFASALQRR
jgi:sigma-E factor negative regulatory protein RseB